MKKQLCNRCKRELDWETKEMVRNMSKDELIKVVFGFMAEKESKT